MKIIKMHGIGNDYVYVNGFDTEVSDPPALARKVSDRHFGVGGDGLIIIQPPSNGEADYHAASLQRRGRLPHGDVQRRR